RTRVLPRVFARPVELTRGQAVTEQQLIDRLNDLGYAERPAADIPGEFSVVQGAVVIRPRGAELNDRLVRVSFERSAAVQRAARRAPPKLSDRVERLELAGRPAERVTLESPLLTSLFTGEREKRRPVAFAALPPTMIQAVLAIEDHRFYDHPGVDV